MTTIAMMQMRVQPNELNRNLWHMRELLSLVGDTDVALFPECCDLGWAADSAPEQAEPIPEGSTYQRIRDMAVDFDIGIIAGITEREGDHIYNSAVFISNTGELLGKHRKINLVPDVEDMYTSGTSVNVFDTKYGRIGIDICADNHMESIMIGEAMAENGRQDDSRTIVMGCTS